MTYELAIIGAGPAGSAAAVYAARKQIKTVLITESFGGQSIVSEEIYNWIGTKAISGSDLAKSLEEHVRSYESEDFVINTGALAQNITDNGDTFTITLSDGNTIEAKTVLTTAGSKRRQLHIPGAHEFEHKGVVYCASCDGPLFSDQHVVVVGGGNAGFESAAQLLAYTKSVTLLHRSAQFKADPITVERVLAHPNMTALLNTEPIEVLGDILVEGVKVKNKETGEESTINATGVFVEIGQTPNTEFLQDLIEKDEYGRVKIDPWTQQTSHPRIWAAGDCTNVHYHQNNIAAGDAVKALEDIYLALKTR